MDPAFKIRSDCGVGRPGEVLRRGNQEGSSWPIPQSQPYAENWRPLLALPIPSTVLVASCAETLYNVEMRGGQAGACFYLL